MYLVYNTMQRTHRFRTCFLSRWFRDLYWSCGMPQGCSSVSSPMTGRPLLSESSQLSPLGLPLPRRALRLGPEPDRESAIVHDYHAWEAAHLASCWLRWETWTSCYYCCPSRTSPVATSGWSGWSGKHGVAPETTSNSMEHLASVVTRSTNVVLSGVASLLRETQSWLYLVKADLGRHRLGVVHCDFHIPQAHGSLRECGACWTQSRRC